MGKKGLNLFTRDFCCTLQLTCTAICRSLPRLLFRSSSPVSASTQWIQHNVAGNIILKFEARRECWRKQRTVTRGLKHVSASLRPHLQIFLGTCGTHLLVGTAHTSRNFTKVLHQYFNQNGMPHTALPAFDLKGPQKRRLPPPRCAGCAEMVALLTAACHALICAGLVPLRLRHKWNQRLPSSGREAEHSWWIRVDSKRNTRWCSLIAAVYCNVIINTIPQHARTHAQCRFVLPEQ